MHTKRNILLTLMALEIGGAETHVLELAKGLKKEGFNVFVASNGGIYVDELEREGIKHFKVPLQNKLPTNMLKSYFMLKKIIKEENIDIVHAHARIPAFICGLLHRSMKFPFVTTTHWIFNTSWGLKYITNWGQRTIAVSEDIAKYLTYNYKVNRDNIKVTINGINMETFSPDTNCEDIKKEFSLKDSNFKIVYISRIDRDRSEVAFQLLKILPDLVKSISNLEVIIVGGGNVYNQINARVNEVNEALGRKVVIATGPRTDINKFTRLSDLFIGVSRSALEAMSSARPVIIAGNEGYIGLFDESKLKTAINSNFTCRGESKSNLQLLKNDILKAVNMTADERDKLGHYSRKIIEEKYSVSVMVNDNIEVYTKLLGQLGITTLKGIE